MAKIAVAIEPPSTRPDSNRSAGHPTARILARGEDWTVADVVCTCGPDDRPFEEQHSQFAIAVVADGTFNIARLLAASS